MHSVGQVADGGDGEMHLENAPDWFKEAQKRAEQAAREIPHADKSSLVTFAAAFAEGIATAADKVNPVKLDGPITLEEWNSARLTQPAIIDQWFYEDVGCFIAPGGTGKTTLLLYQAIHIVTGRPLFGYAVLAPGPVVILTAEDSRETLVARLRLMCWEMDLTGDEMCSVREDIIITDVSGKGIKLTAVDKDVVIPSGQLDKLVVEVGVLRPSVLMIDPAVSFGVGESRVNDAEQGLIDAARRIRNVAQCAVIFSHHTGKANARDRTRDQYSGRGGSAMADGSRMVHVLQRLDPDEWTEATGDTLEGTDSGFVLARSKMTWCSPQPDIYIKRHSYTFERYSALDATEGAGAVTRINADKLHEFLKDEFVKGTKHTGRTLEAAKFMPQKATREALQRLVADSRVVSEDLGGGGRGGARTYLRPIDLPMTT